MTVKLHFVIDQLISYTQTTLIRGRSIYDGWVTAFEVLDMMKNNGENLIFKLYFEKAYNWVN